jgi:sugar/nucleoside kinase (ribokinase family)
VAQHAKSLPAAGGKGTADSVYMDVGGPAANAAITASGLGASAQLTTVVGGTDLAEYARTVLHTHGVLVDDRAPGEGVPVASIWISAGTGERTILATNNSEVRPELGPALREDTNAVLLDGHYADLAAAIAAEADAGRVPVVLDCGRWRPVYARLLPLATDIIMCQTFRPPGFEGMGDRETLVGIYQRWQPEFCVMTRGGDDVLIVDEGGLTSFAVPQVAVVDTMGAGDVLHGAYVYWRYAAGLRSVAALEAAIDLASRSCTHLGVRAIPKQS